MATLTIDPGSPCAPRGLPRLLAFGLFEQWPLPVSRSYLHLFRQM